mgnify:FL=1
MINMDLITSIKNKLNYYGYDCIYRDTIDGKVISLINTNNINISPENMAELLKVLYKQISAIDCSNKNKCLIYFKNEI